MFDRAGAVTSVLAIGVTAVSFNPADYRKHVVQMDGDQRGTFHARGWPDSNIPEEANVKRPDIVRDAADAFLDAGAKVLTTNTVGAPELVLGGEGESDDAGRRGVLEICRAGASIHRAAVSDHPAEDLLVFGALGPTERLLMFGEIDEGALDACYRTLAEALAAGGADAILCCSFTEIRALCVAVRAAEAATGLPVIGGMVFDSGPDQAETSLGVTVPQACAELAEVGVAAVGCGCGGNPDGMPALVALMRQACELPIWVKVDAGLPQLVDGRVAHPELPSEFALRMGALAAAGANFVGGCCGASPEHTAAGVVLREKRGDPP